MNSFDVDVFLLVEAFDCVDIEDAGPLFGVDRDIAREEDQDNDLGLL